MSGQGGKAGLFWNAEDLKSAQFSTMMRHTQQ